MELDIASGSIFVAVFTGACLLAPLAQAVV
jgi:hypothetical protein